MSERWFLPMSHRTNSLFTMNKLNRVNISLHLMHNQE